MIRRSDITASAITADGTAIPEGGVYITIRNDVGDLATLYGDDGSLMANPFQSGTDGVFVYNVADADAGTFTEEYRLSPSSSPRTIRAVDLEGDGGLRTDLAASTGSALVGTDDGTTLASRLAGTPSPLFYGWKSPARTLNDALRVIAAVPAQVVGYAAGTTGGDGGTRFLVNDNSYDSNRPNTFYDCYNRARALGGSAAKVIQFDTRGHFNVLVPVTLLLDAVMNNITIVAPGLNVTFWTDTLVATVSITGKNMIFYGIEFRTLPGTLAAYDDTTGTKTEKKLVAVDPTVCDKIAFINCAFQHASDGSSDVAGQLFANTPQCRVSFINCIYRDTDQPMMLGAAEPITTFTADATADTLTVGATFYAGIATGDPVGLTTTGTLPAGVATATTYYAIKTGTSNTLKLATSKANALASTAIDLTTTGTGTHSVSALVSATDPAVLKVTLYNVVFEYCAERKPKVLGRCDVHAVNVIDEFLPFRRDQLPPTNELSAAYGATAMFGGTLTIDSALWMSADGVTGRSATIVDSVANGVGTLIDGAIEVVNSAAEDGMTIQTGNTSRIPVRPYTLAGTPVPAAGPLRDAWIANLRGMVGARPNSAPRGEWVWTASTTDYPNGDTVLRDRKKGGRWLRTDYPSEYRALGDWPVAISGNYVPTLTAITNCSALALSRANYQQVGKRVSVSVVVTGTLTTTAVSTSIGVSLPVARDFTSTADLEGSCRAVSATNQVGGYVNADAVNDRAQATLTPTTATGGAFTVGLHFSYMLT